MRNAAPALIAALLIVAPVAASAQTDDFEALVEEALGRDSGGEGAAPATAVPPRLRVRPAPAEPGASPAEPGAPPPAAPALDPALGPPLEPPLEPPPDDFAVPEPPMENLAPPAVAAPAPAPAAPAAPAAEAPRPYTPPTRQAAPAPAPPAAGAPAAAEGPADAPAIGEPVQAAPAPPPAGPTMAELDVAAVNAATFAADGAESPRGASPLILKAQILLDRAGASPGVIDGYYGGNVAKAIAAVEAVLELPVDGRLDPNVWGALGGDQAPPVLVQYTITPEDAAYPFLENIPRDYAVQATLPALGFTSPEEMFSERFHMDIKLVKALNPGADFRRAGATIVVADIQGQPVTGKIARIEADKRARQVRAYDVQDRLVVAYPATIGSADNPSPSGTHVVNTIAPNPIYYYNPANFVQGENRQRLDLPPGPNNPVGTMWIDLSEPSYGIHGTPEPSKIDKTGSHGCIRLTNWDAEELATLVQAGVQVTFTE